ncbi:MAG: PKD domain-containing protein [archaeon]
MKSAFAFFLILTLLTTSVAALHAEILPNEPDEGHSLLCQVDEWGNFIYLWYRNNQWQSGFTTDYIPSGNTIENEVWRCDVYYPGFYVPAATDQVTIRCTDTDGDGVCNHDEIPLTNVIATATPLEGTAPLTVTLSCSATGGNPPLSFRWDTNGDDMIDMTGQVVTATYDPGIHQASCLVRDSDNDAMLVQTPLITVHYPSAPPTLYTIGNKQVDEGQTLTIILNATDPNDDNITFSANPLPYGAQLNGNTFIWTPTYEQAGTYTVTFSASDGLLSDNETIIITVFDVNRPPVIQPLAPITVAEGESISLQIVAEDPDCDDWDCVDITALNAPVGSRIGRYGLFTWTPGYDQAGTYVIMFVASDGLLEDRENLTITVTDVNRAPVIQPIPPITVAEGESISLQIVAEDPDCDDWDCVDITAPNAPRGSRMGRYGLFTWTPGYDQAGTYVVTFVASDGFLEDRENVTITVTNVPQPPYAQFTYSPVHPVSGQEVFFDASSSFDVDGPITSYAWDFTSDGYVDAYGVNTTHAFAQGTYVVTLRVGQGGQYVFTNRTLIVETSPNHPPVLQPIGDKTIAEGALLSFVISATDEDDDPLSFNAGNLPTGASFNPTTRTFSWTPNYNQAGVYAGVLFNVSDGQAYDYEAIRITVLNTNRPPDAQWNYTPQPAHVNETTLFNVTFSHDPDNDPLTFDWDFDNDGTWDAHGRTATHVFTRPDPAYVVLLRVFDGTNYTYRMRQVSVLPIINRPPVADFVFTPEHPVSGEPVTFHATAADPDHDPLTYAWDFTNDGSIDATGNTSTHTFEAGLYAVRLVVSDGQANTTVIHNVLVSAVQQLSVAAIDCFPVVIQHSEQVCTIALQQALSDATITFFANTGTTNISKTCMTNDQGRCIVRLTLSTLGVYTAYAHAELQGYLPDLDATPNISFAVVPRRYTIVDLHTYNDSVFMHVDDTFFRGEDLYVQFGIRNSLDDPETRDVVTSVTLISIATGARITLDSLGFFDGHYRFGLRPIPITHDFIGTGEVFAFYINYTDTAGDQKSTNITILNNPPQIVNLPAAITLTTGHPQTIFLGEYEHDLEDRGTNLTWSIVQPLPPVPFLADLQGKQLTLTPQFTGSGQLALTLKDLDLDQDEAVMIVHVIPGENHVPIAQFTYTPAHPLVGETVLFNATDSTDPDGDLLQYAWDFNNDGNYESTGRIVLHSFPLPGGHVVRLNVSDGRAWNVVEHTISVEGGNHPPVLQPIGDKTVQEENTLSFTIHATDPDNDALYYTAHTLPQGSTFNNRTFSWTPSYDQAGDYPITFIVSDGQLTDNETITIHVLNTNRPPHADFTISPEHPATGSITFDATASSDPDNDLLLYYWDFTGDGNWDDTGRIVHRTYTEPGTYTARLLVFDGSASDGETKTFTVSATLHVELSCFDRVIQHHNQSCQARVIDDHDMPVARASVTFSFANGAIFGTCTTDSLSGGCSALRTMHDLGEYAIYATATKQHYPDGTAGPFTFTVLAETYTITGLSTFNDSLFMHPDTIFYRNEPLYVSFNVRDSKGQYVDNLPAEVDLVSPRTGGRLRLRAVGNAGHAYRYAALPIPPTHDFLGEGFVFSFVFDNNVGGEAQTAILIFNNPPTIDPLPAQQLHSGESISIHLSGHDIEDEHNLQWSVRETSDAITAWIIGTTLHITALQEGNATVTVSVQDLDGDTAEEALLVQVIAAENTLPVFTFSAPGCVQEGRLLSFLVTAYDADGDELTYTTSALPRGASFTDQLFSWTPDYDQADNYTVTFTVSDGHARVSIGTVLCVLNLNREPTAVINYTPILPRVNERITFDGSRSYDRDNDPLVQYAWDLNDDGVFETEGRIVQHTFTTPGRHDVFLLVSDGQLADTTDARVDVLAQENHAPIFDPLPELGCVPVGTIIHFTVSASDPDGDAVTITAASLPEGAVFQQGTFDWTPTQPGNYTIVFTASDGQLETQQTITLCVLQGNRPPVFYPIADPACVTEGETITFSVSASDPDGDVLVYSATDLPSGAQFTQQTFSWNTQQGQAGTYAVQFSVSDGEFTDAEDVNLCVQHLNEAPQAVITSPEDESTFITGQTITFTGYCTDAEQGQFPGTWSIVGKGVIGEGYTVHTTIDEPNTYQVRMQCVDAQGEESSADIRIHVVAPGPLDAVLSPPFTGFINEVVRINGEQSQGTNLTYTWQVQNSVLTTIVPYLDTTFSTIGQFPVTLLVRDQYGRTDMAMATYRIVERSTAKQVVDERGMLSILQLDAYGSQEQEPFVVQQGEDLMVYALVKNEEDKIKDVRMTVVIPELAIKAKTGAYDLGKGKRQAYELLVLMDDAPLGEYEAHVSISNGKVTRAKYVPVLVTDKTCNVCKK